ncbi:uncharacterized protein LOC115700075 isoform X2 [Cannabis sativa]|uniref:uncharacterized protein LOC115700075 isoform X2 n=1 Tax=Cannabis sativa TaxID=3483 RepID=UPI0011DFE600|nr:uncharacterized protein LOC115700075 isoform X2 [Cannabis sativa]
MDSDIEESQKKKLRKSSYSGGDYSRKCDVWGELLRQLEQFPRRPYDIMGELTFIQDDDIRLETTRDRFFDALKRHGVLVERLSRDSDKMIFERLQNEFEAARSSQTQEICLDGEEWNDGLLATIRERVHMEADRKAMSGDTNDLASPLVQEKITYKVGSKVICCLEGARIGIQYETSFAGEPCELYHCVLESKSFLEKMTVLEHTLPFFLPIKEAENDLLSSNAMKFIDYIGELLQAYVDRREQVRLVKELYGNQIGELYHSLPYQMIEFSLDDFDCKVTIALGYVDPVSVLPSRIKVQAWPVQQSKKNSSNTSRKENEITEGQTGPVRLLYAEDALRTMSLPEAYAEIVLNLPRALQQIFQQRASTT